MDTTKNSHILEIFKNSSEDDTPRLAFHIAELFYKIGVDAYNDDLRLFLVDHAPVELLPHWKSTLNRNGVFDGIFEDGYFYYQDNNYGCVKFIKDRSSHAGDIHQVRRLHEELLQIYPTPTHEKFLRANLKLSGVAIALLLLQLAREEKLDLRRMREWGKDIIAEDEVWRNNVGPKYSVGSRFKRTKEERLLIYVMLCDEGEIQDLCERIDSDTVVRDKRGRSARYYCERTLDNGICKNILQLAGQWEELE